MWLVQDVLKMLLKQSKNLFAIILSTTSLYISVYVSMAYFKNNTHEFHKNGRLIFCI